MVKKITPEELLAQYEEMDNGLTTQDPEGEYNDEV